MSSSLHLISDHSKEKLQDVPSKVLEMTNLKMLFLEGNFLYKLPEDFFWKLPKLVWLDLRNNQLDCIPQSIAHHEYLENLLLTNNNLKKLPNELGLVSKLKALQVSENPLIYPVRKVLVEGTRAIKTYLKEQFEKLSQMPNTPKELTNDDDKKHEPKEELINIQNLSTSEESVNIKPKYSKIKKKKDSHIDLKESIKKRISDPRALQPTLNVKKLSNTPKITEKENKGSYNEPLKIVHKISRNGGTISLTSCLDRIGSRNCMGKIMESGLKEGWLNQLRILLSDQEKILQQERTLRALSDWRMKRRCETPKVFQDGGHVKPAPPPYATYPEYAKTPTREALAAQVDAFFMQRGSSRSGLEPGYPRNIDKLINDLVEQLKEMERTYGVARSPRSEIAEAEKQIKTITDIHKKLLQLKTCNNLAI